MKLKLNLLILLSLLILAGCNSSALNEKQIEWSELKIVGSKPVQTGCAGIKDSTDWPILNSSVLKLDGNQIIIEGYYACMESMDLETLQTEQVCMVTISKKPTIIICGVSQFRQNEFFRLSTDINVEQGKRIKLKGTLRINQDGSKGSLLNLENPELI